MRKMLFLVRQEDVVMTRVITSGVGSTTVLDPPMKYTVVDVGGQRNERKKWLHCFDDVKAVVFLISLAGYNQVCIPWCMHIYPRQVFLPCPSAPQPPNVRASRQWPFFLERFFFFPSPRSDRCLSAANGVQFWLSFLLGISCACVEHCRGGAVSTPSVHNVICSTAGVGEESGVATVSFLAPRGVGRAVRRMRAKHSTDNATKHFHAATKNFHASLRPLGKHARARRHHHNLAVPRQIRQPTHRRAYFRPIPPSYWTPSAPRGRIVSWSTDLRTVTHVTSAERKVMFEDVRQNRLLEALDLYEQVVGNPIFR